ncbi:CLAVATA3/ESR (CLE)-RELATED PROTEIN 3 [Salix viminalis]|uniref:CLAVATA3/ESR (CLE)-RELATED PROTEIN 3 n=1 Tax=Salix viminalis TaxID=40686 RepID=A0A6N2NA95_SALVM|nr:hypothetical protein IMY05_004G0038300 [Salix suchowensis]KAJ6707146.1 CLAVATA3/ESR (CLE)-RELATED PROTEIN 3 [Salix viminalis]
MASLRCYLCVLLIVLSFAQSDARPRDPSVVRRNLIRTIRALGESEAFSVQFASKRVSPGGPDAQHH